MIQTAGATGNKTGTIAANDDWITIVAALSPEPIAASSSANTTYTYDANGNMTSDGVKCYQFNEANQLDKVTNCSSQTIAEYVYDYNGLRMVKRNFTNGTLANTVTSWSDAYETKVVESGGTENVSYYFVNGQLISKKNNSGTRTFFHNDHLGSTSVVTNSSGSLVETTQYDPWGKVNVGGTSSKFLYTGQERDGETGLHYYNARYYNSDIRRFTQPDDIVEDIYDPQMLNRYSYVRNNPLRYTDPSGNCIGPLILACGAIAATAARYAPAIINTATKWFTSPAVKNTVTTVTNAAKSVASNVANAAKSSISSTINASKSFISNPGNPSKNNASNTASQPRNVPNPHGRGGGPAHQSTINNNIKNFESQGHRLIKTEFQVDTPGGYKATRFADFAMEAPNGKTILYQVGRQTKSGLPVKDRHLPGVTASPPVIFHHSPWSDV